MPTYEYECKNCQHTWEEQQTIKEPAHIFCPKCDQTTANRLISKSTFVLTPGGVGWASTNYSK